MDAMGISRNTSMVNTSQNMNASASGASSNSRNAQQTANTNPNNGANVNNNNSVDAARKQEEERRARRARLNEQNNQNSVNGQNPVNGQNNQGQTQRQIQNVVSTSTDGDTVQVDPRKTQVSNQANSNDGTVSRREQMQIDARKAAEEKARMQATRERQRRVRDEANARNLNNRIATQRENSQMNAKESGPNSQNSIMQSQQNRSDRRSQIREDSANRADQRANDQRTQNLAGVSKSQLERMYQQGQISKREYDLQMARREEQQANSTSDNSAQSRQMARLNGIRNQAQMDSNAIRTAYSNNANANAPVDANGRMAAMQRVTDNMTQQQTAANNEGRRQWAYQLQA